MITLDDVRDARRRIAGITRPTPVDRSDSLSRRLGRQVILKPEHLQRTGSFKIRGAYNLVSRLPADAVVGVEAAGAAAVRASLDAGRLVCLDRVATMADGIAAKSPSELTMAHIRAHVHDVVTVTEEDISRAVLLLLERAKAVVEPAGAATLAALLAGKGPGPRPAR